MDATVFTDSVQNGCNLNVDDFYSKYSLGERLGDGMSSVVYKCSNPCNTNKKLAVKIIDLLKGDLSEEALRAEVHREIDILKELAGHLFIINIVSSLETIANIFIVTDLCEDGDLYDFMAERITLQTTQTIVIMRQLACAVEYIHSHFIVHRDIKLENILLSSRKHLSIRLADFGLAVRVKGDTDITEIVGTPSYFAPELIFTAKGQAVGYGRPVDIWACGVIMYTLLTGRGPFQNIRQHVMFRSIMNGNYDKTDFLWQSSKPELKNLAAGMLVVDPEMRLKVKEFEKKISSSCLSGYFTFIRKEEMERQHPSLKIVAIAVRACIRLLNLALVIKGDIVKNDPFSSRLGREIITSTVAEIYGHWLKKNQRNQVVAINTNVGSSYGMESFHTASDVSPMNSNSE